MKLLTIVLFASAALAAVAQGEAGFPEETGFVAEIQENEAEVVTTPNLRRLHFMAGSGTGTTPAPVTPAPATPTPATPAPATPTPATPAPATSSPATPTPATPSPQTPAPSTATPSPTPTSTPATGSGSGTKTPAPATTAPTATPTTTPSTTTDTTTATVAPSSGKSDTSSSSSVSGSLKPSTKTPAPTPTSADTNTKTDSKMSTGTIAGIVGGIIAGIVVLAFVTMALIRRKRDNDDDPLSPFELSMDKGYSGAQAYGGNPPGFAGNNAAARGNAPARSQELATDTPPAGAVAAGVAYSQFYDVTTSPGSINNQQPRRNSSGHHDEPVADNAANLWMSAMDVKENDSYLSAKESHDGDSLNSGRNSYDVGYVDDQSSQISGSSDLNSAKDFPDYEDESARGSYEL